MQIRSSTNGRLRSRYFGKRCARGTVLLRFSKAALVGNELYFLDSNGSVEARLGLARVAGCHVPPKPQRRKSRQWPSANSGSAPPLPSSSILPVPHAIIIAAMISAATAITAVAIQPTSRSPSLTGNPPMIAGLWVMCIMVIITGTATTPLMTALQ
jgi:hypothetical protein